MPVELRFFEQESGKLHLCYSGTGRKQPPFCKIGQLPQVIPHSLRASFRHRRAGRSHQSPRAANSPDLHSLPCSATRMSGRHTGLCSLIWPPVAHGRPLYRRKSLTLDPSPEAHGCIVNETMNKAGGRHHHFISSSKGWAERRAFSAGHACKMADASARSSRVVISRFDADSVTSDTSCPTNSTSWASSVMSGPTGVGLESDPPRLGWLRAEAEAELPSHGEMSPVS